MKKFGIYNNKKEISLEKVGKNIYYSYYLLKLFIFAFNFFIIYNFFHNQNYLFITSLILNIIYLLIYYRRLWINILSIIIIFYFTHHIYNSIIIGLAIGNGISYIIDFIVIRFISFLMDLLERISLKGK